MNYSPEDLDAPFGPRSDEALQEPEELVAHAVRSFLRQSRSPQSDTGLGSIGAMRDAADELDEIGADAMKHRREETSRDISVEESLGRDRRLLRFSSREARPVTPPCCHHSQGKGSDAVEALPSGDCHGFPAESNTPPLGFLAPGREGLTRLSTRAELLSHRSRTNRPAYRCDCPMLYGRRSWSLTASSFLSRATPSP